LKIENIKIKNPQSSQKKGKYLFFPPCETLPNVFKDSQNEKKKIEKLWNFKHHCLKIVDLTHMLCRFV
jgi:hypothetical protein